MDAFLHSLHALFHGHGLDQGGALLLCNPFSLQMVKWDATWRQTLPIMVAELLLFFLNGDFSK